MEDNKIKVGITQGDINGVGYEVILKALSESVGVKINKQGKTLTVSY